MSNSDSSRIVDLMYNNDAFSKWLGIERIEEREGYCKLKMTVRSEMLNGFGIAHGGITYSLADSALAFASNGHGIQSVSIETVISHLKKVNLDDTLFAEAEEISLSSRIGIYDVRITNEAEETVAIFKGTVFRTGRRWLNDDK
ncbi:MAG: hotdog fold thioesterase [Flavobacteriales bacterium]|nr:hotdog fold thioesterase [Flavobacteriales bacterium]